MLGSSVVPALRVGSLPTIPAGLGRWPAVAAFAGFVWLELVALAGPSTLFVVLLGYTAYTLAMMAQFGRDTWRSHGEAFTVWFRLLGRLAPFALADEDGRLRRRSFASGLMEPGWTRADVTLVAVGVGSILFDGLSQTQVFFDLFGAPGVLIKTLLLAAFLGIVVLAAFAVTRTVGLAATGAGLLPIALGYLIAHYLTYLLIDGQRIVIAISDPFQKGWDLFGTAFYTPVRVVAATGSRVDAPARGRRGRPHARGVGRPRGGRGRGAAGSRSTRTADAAIAARCRHGRPDDADAVVARPGDRGEHRGLRRGWRRAPSAAVETTSPVDHRDAHGAPPQARTVDPPGTHESSDRTSESRSAIAGSSASAAAMAVSIAVKHRIPSAVAA